MAMEPELRLRFSHYSQYRDWKTGLELMRQLLEQPSHHLAEDASGDSPSLFASTKTVPHSLLRTLLLEGLLPGGLSSNVLSLIAGLGMYLQG